MTYRADDRTRPDRRATARERRVAARVAALALATLLQACATPNSIAPQPTPAPTDVTTGVSPVFQPAPAGAAPSNPARESIAALVQPLDATRLPPFDGERLVVRDPLRVRARIDRTITESDLWQRIRLGFAMPDLDNALVREKMAWYAARPDYLRRTLERARRYLFHIVEEIEKRGMPTELALLPMVESSFNPMAYSRAHASGLWQFIPPTGRRYSLEQNWWYDARRDIVASTAAALDYLRDVYEMHGDWHLALASYNWGENAVARALEKNRAAGQRLDYAHINMPEETRHYVPKLQALKNIVLDPGPFGIDLEPIPNAPYFQTVAGTRDLDVHLAAKLAEMPVEEFVALNPGFNRPLMPQALNARIVLPADRVERFHANLLKLGGEAPVNWQTYRPKAGESLDAIARKFKLSLARLMEVNGLQGRVRHAPALLVVPVDGTAIPAKRLPIMYAPPIPARATARTHTVKRGDTLWGIAQRYDVEVDDLRRWNRIGRLLPGQTLVVSPGATEPQKSHEVRKSRKNKN